MLSRVKLNSRLLSLRIAVFNIIFVDYVGICLRTLGQGVGTVYQSTWDILGFCGASFLLLCMVLELLFVFTKINKIHKTKKKDLSKREKVIYEVFYEALVDSRVRESWFVRNYQLLNLIRYFTIVFFLVNLQYLQVLQVTFSLIIFVGFGALTFIYQLCKGGIFESRWDRVWKLAQEASFSIMILIIGLFCLDSFKNTFSVSVKKKLALALTFLLVVNVMIELIMALVTVISILLGICLKLKNSGKQKIQKNHPILSSKKLHQILPLDTRTDGPLSGDSQRNPSPKNEGTDEDLEIELVGGSMKILSKSEQNKSRPGSKQSERSNRNKQGEIFSKRSEISKLLGQDVIIKKNKKKEDLPKGDIWLV